MPKIFKTPSSKDKKCIGCGRRPRMLLYLDNPKSSRYLVFDHWIPGDPHKIVITSALINTMKSDMLEDEFWDTIFQLADYKRLGKPVNIKDPVHWWRLYHLKE